MTPGALRSPLLCLCRTDPAARSLQLARGLSRDHVICISRARAYREGPAELESRGYHMPLYLGPGPGVAGKPFRDTQTRLIQGEWMSSSIPLSKVLHGCAEFTVHTHSPVIHSGHPTPKT